MLQTNIVRQVLGSDLDRVHYSSGRNGEINFRSWQSFYTFLSEILQKKIDCVRGFLPTVNDELTREKLRVLWEQKKELSRLQIIRDYGVDLSAYYQRCSQFGLNPKCLYKTRNLKLIWRVSSGIPPELSPDNLERFLLLWAALVARKPGEGKISIRIDNIRGTNLKLTVPFFPSKSSDVAALRFTSQKIQRIQEFINKENWPTSDANDGGIQRQEEMYSVTFVDLARMFKNEEPELAVSSIYNSIRLG